MRRFRSSALQEDYIALFELMCVLPKLRFCCFSPDYTQVNNNLLCSLFTYCLFWKYPSLPGFYFSPSSVTGCLPCLCHVAGSVNQICDKLTGQCICQDASVTGQTCERCKEHYFGFDSVTGRWVFPYYRSFTTSSLYFSDSSSFKGLVTMKRCALVTLILLWIHVCTLYNVWYIVQPSVLPWAEGNRSFPPR